MATPPAKKAKRGRLMESLYDQVKAINKKKNANSTYRDLIQNDINVIFVVDVRKLYAHKAIVLASSRGYLSSAFEEKIGQQLESGVGKMGVIELPEGTRRQAGEVFVKAMYFEEIDPSTELDLVVEVMSLCDAFFDQSLLNSCMDSVMERITAKNCVAICNASLDWENCERLSDASFESLIKNIKEILEKSDDALTSISSQLWRKVFSQLQGPEVDISELVLFQQLLKWRNADETGGREVEFKSLLLQIRFPLMTCTTLAAEIQPRGVLTCDELNDIYTYVAGGGKNGNSIPKFVTHSRKTLYAKTGGELLALLKSAKPGDYISLMPGEYEGPFTIPDKVTLQGSGTSTAITCSASHQARAIVKILSDVKISDLQILYLGPSQPTKEILGLAIKGSRNTIKNVLIENCSVHMAGNHNLIDKITCSSPITNVGQNNLITRWTIGNEIQVKIPEPMSATLSSPNETSESSNDSNYSNSRKRTLEDSGEAFADCSKTSGTRRMHTNNKVLDSDLLDELISDLMKHGYARPFLRPVTRTEVPDYGDIVKYPMDLGTIKYKLDSMVYTYNEEFVSDLALVFTNCFLYNTRWG